MKKFTKITALAVAIIMLCISLSGCASLDLMKEQHAYWTNDNIDSITLSNNETYIRLDNEIADELMYNSYEWNDVYVTDNDVPVLLSESYGSVLSMTDDKNFIYGFIYTEKDSEGNLCAKTTTAPTRYSIRSTINYFNPFAFSAYTQAYNEALNEAYYTQSDELDVTYCKEEIYDDIVKQYEAGIEYTHYGYDYYIYYEDFMEKPEDYYLSDEEGKVIEKIFKEVKPKTNTEPDYEKFYLSSMYHYSDNRTFGKYTCEIFSNENYDEFMLYVYIESLDTYDCYEVPQKYSDDMYKICEKAIDAFETEVDYDVKYYD